MCGQTAPSPNFCSLGEGTDSASMVGGGASASTSLVRGGFPAVTQ